MDRHAPVLLASTAELDRHDTGRNHPERYERLDAVLAGVEHAGVREAVCAIACGEASSGELARVHDVAYLRRLEETVASRSLRTARYAAGSGLAAIELLRLGLGDSAFIAARPPGHLASGTAAGGFCLLNNVAVGAAALASQGERVAVVDFDAHHGSGTQAIFWNDPRVLTVSLHEPPPVPGTGGAEETGGAAAPGTNVNVSLPAGSTGAAARDAMVTTIGPAIERFGPTWVLIAAGFDAHRDDPRGRLCFTAADFADLTRDIVAFAPKRGRVVAYLEGGYDLPALARCAGATIAALAGVEWRPEPASSR